MCETSATEDQPRDQPADRVRDRPRDPVRGRPGERVRDPVQDRVRDREREQPGDRVREQLPADLAAAVAGALPGGHGPVDLHLHFLPDPVLRKVWAYFDDAERRYGRAWPIRYRLPEAERVNVLRDLGVEAFAPLVYAHRPGMAAWLNGWVAQFAAATPGAVPTATFYPEPGVEGYLTEALDAGARCAKLHVQVAAIDPRDRLLDPAWGLLAAAGIPVVVHCGDGPLRGAFTGIGIFAEVLRRHPMLTAVIAHAGLPDYLGALDLVHAFPRVYLDTTMVGTAFAQQLAPLPVDWPARLADVPGRVVLGSDFPNIPYPYAEQLAAVLGWSRADGRLGPGFLRAVLHDTPARLLGLACADVPAPRGASRLP